MRGRILRATWAHNRKKGGENMQNDEIKAIASASEWTGMLPAIPWDGKTDTVRSMMRVHLVKGKVYRRRKD